MNEASRSRTPRRASRPSSRSTRFSGRSTETSTSGRSASDSRRASPPRSSWARHRGASTVCWAEVSALQSAASSSLRSSRLPRASRCTSRSRGSFGWTRRGCSIGDAMKIADFQNLIRRADHARDKKRGLDKDYLWFTEEVGELAEAVRKRDRKEIFAEAADVFAWLCTVCSISGVDLQDRKSTR